MSLLDLQAIRETRSMSSVVGAALKLVRAGGEYKALCPFHNERTPSFTVNDDKGFAHCFGCGWHGDALDFLQHFHGVSLREAAALLSGEATEPRRRVNARSNSADRDTTAEAISIWREAGPAADTPAEVYLRARGLTSAIPETIRFARLRYGSSGDRRPCLVALVTSAERKPIGAQRTYLRTDGSAKAAVDKPKLSLGRVRGGAIRLAPPAAELIVCEGLEDALTLQQELGRTAWASAGASMLPAMRFPPDVRSIVIGADNDAAGDREARKAAQAFSSGGLAVRLMRPEPGFKDFNDQLRGVRA